MAADMQMKMKAYEAAIRLDENALDALLRPLDRVESPLELNAKLWTRDGTQRALLHLAASEGRQKTVELLLKKGADKDLEDGFGLKPLHLAARKGHTNVVETLLKHGADTTASIADGKTLFHFAAESGNVGVVNALLRFGAEPDITKKDKYKNTILHFAALSVSRSILEDILDLQNVSQDFATVANAPNKNGETPLHLAAKKGNLQAVQQLLGIGGEKNGADHQGVTPFHCAAQSGQEEVMAILQLADLNQKTNDGKTALHIAAAEGQTEAVKWLLGQGAMVGEGDMEGNTALHSAVMFNQTETVKCLVEAGASLSCLNLDGMMPVSYCMEEIVRATHSGKGMARAIHMKGEMAQALLHHSLDITREVNVDVGAADKYGSTVLHFAAAFPNRQEIEGLLNRGADAAQTDDFGNTPLHYAARQGSKTGALALLNMTRKKPEVDAENNAKQTPLWYAVQSECQQLVEYLFRRSQNPLKSIAAALIFEYKKEYGDKIDIDHRHKVCVEKLPSCYLALHIEREEIFDFLSKFCKDTVNARDEEFQRTSLHWAVLSGRVDAVSKLIAVDEVRATPKDKHGKSPFQYAHQNKNTQIQEKLLERKEVNGDLKALYTERQMYVDASNAILVGGALIAGVTFSGWLQPPLGYTEYYDFPVHFAAAPPDSFESYAALAQHRSVRKFWIFNSLSFFFAMASVLAGTAVMLPNQGAYIAEQVKEKRFALYCASDSFIVSVVLVISAFATAGFAALPPIHKYQNHMRMTVIVGGIECFLTMYLFQFKFYNLGRAVVLETIIKLAQGCEWFPKPILDKLQRLQMDDTKDPDHTVD